MRIALYLTILLCVAAKCGAQGSRNSQFGASQNAIIDVKAFDAGMQRYSRPPDEWQGKPRRIRRTTKANRGDGSRSTEVDELWEFDTSGSFRRVTIVNSPNRRSEQESITVGTYTYTRIDGGLWQRKDREPYGLVGPPVGPFETMRTVPPGTFKYYNPGAVFEFKLGTSEYKGQTLLVYTRTVVYSKTRETTGMVDEIEHLNRYWLAEDGRIVKFEDVQFNRKTGAETRSTQEWELDPSLQITPPQLNRRL